MVELVYTAVLEAAAARIGGSNPFGSTMKIYVSFFNVPLNQTNYYLYRNNFIPTTYIRQSDRDAVPLPRNWEYMYTIEP